jgi:hypothetical protein
MAVLWQILEYHVVPNVAAKGADLSNGQVLPTLDGSQTLTVSSFLPEGHVRPTKASCAS